MMPAFRPRMLAACSFTSITFKEAELSPFEIEKKVNVGFFI